MLPPYVNSSATRWHITGNPIASYSIEPFGKHWEEDVGPCFPRQQLQLSSANITQTIGKKFAQYWGKLWPDSLTYHNTLYKSMFDTYQQYVTYSLRPRTAHCMQSWCQSVVVIYVEKQCLAGVETLAQPPTCRMDAR